MKCCKQTSGGFSVVELLVCIIIAGILIVLTVAGVSRLRSQGNSVGCMTNMRQIQSAIMVWASEHDGAFPYTYSYGPILPGMVGQSAKNRNWSGQLIENHYLDSWKVFKCPSAPISWSADPDSINHYARDGYSVHYAYNGYLSLPEGEASAFPRKFFFGKMANVTSPSQIIMLQDAGFASGDNPTRGFYSFYEGDRAHARHDGKVNVAYVDGHMAALEKVTPKDTPDDPLGKYHIRKLD